MVDAVVWICSTVILTYCEGRFIKVNNNGISATLSEETSSVPKTNTISERDFAQLDRFLRKKPNASVLSCERAELLKSARMCAPEFKKLYQVQKAKMLEDRAKLLQAKQAALAQLRQKN